MKMADCGSDVKFKNDKYCYDENNWRLTLTTNSLHHFGELRPITSHFAVRTLTDFLAKARLLDDRDVNFICRYLHNGCIYKQIARTMCCTLIYDLFR